MAVPFPADFSIIDSRTTSVIPCRASRQRLPCNSCPPIIFASTGTPVAGALSSTTWPHLKPPFCSAFDPGRNRLFFFGNPSIFSFRVFPQFPRHRPDHDSQSDGAEFFSGFLFIPPFSQHIRSGSSIQSAGSPSSYLYDIFAFSFLVHFRSGTSTPFQPIQIYIPHHSAVSLVPHHHFLFFLLVNFLHFFFHLVPVFPSPRFNGGVLLGPLPIVTSVPLVSAPNLRLCASSLEFSCASSLVFSCAYSECASYPIRMCCASTLVFTIYTS